MTIGQFLLTLIVIFAAAKLFGELAERIGQPAVLGELFGGVVVGVSGLHLVNPHDPAVHLLSELGVVLLLFLIGLETDIRKLLAVGGPSMAVAVVGVTVPFVLGYGVGIFLGHPPVLAVFLGAALTATSVGITARVLSDLGRLDDKEAQIVLGAAVFDDIIGLVILAVVESLVHDGGSLSAMTVVRITAVAFGFVVLAVVIGNLLAPLLIRLISNLRVSHALFFAAVMFAFALAYIAETVGSAVIVGSFAAGLVLARTEKGPQIEREVHDIAQFFIPIFFVTVGAAVDLRSVNPLDPATRPFFYVGLALTIVAILGKIVSGWAAYGPGVNRLAVGVGMIPRGEVGLIFAAIGLEAGLLTTGLYSSVALMVIVTSFTAPILLRRLLPRIVPPTPAASLGAVAGYVSDAPGGSAWEGEQTELESFSERGDPLGVTAPPPGRRPSDLDDPRGSGEDEQREQRLERMEHDRGSEAEPEHAVEDESDRDDRA
jgi:Kef-type K+ transport system membrane component KefB